VGLILRIFLIDCRKYYGNPSSLQNFSTGKTRTPFFRKSLLPQVYLIKSWSGLRASTMLLAFSGSLGGPAFSDTADYN